MKRRAVILLLTVSLTAGMIGTGAQAMTYAYEAGTQEEALSAEEKQKLENWHKEEMRQQIAYLEKYGVSYDADTDTLYYQGQTVRWLIDEQIDDTYMAIQMPQGEIDVYTQRGNDYQLTGLRVASQEEYDERTRKDENAKAENARLWAEAEEDGTENGFYFKIEDGEYISGEEGGVVRYTPADGSVIHTFADESSCVLYSEEPDNDGVTYSVIAEGTGTDSGDITFHINETDGEAVAVETETEDVIEDTNSGLSIETTEVAEGFGFVQDNEEWRQKQKEYEAAGIGHDSTSGSWIWQGKPVYFLMDENGSMYQNGSKEAKENKIYILVTRDADGSIDTVKQVTMEEVLKERILQELE